MLANVPPSREQQLKQKYVVAHQSDDCPTMLSGWNFLRVTSTIDMAETSPKGDVLTGEEPSALDTTSPTANTH